MWPGERPGKGEIIMSNQKELKQRYAEILAKDVWHGDKSMIDYCVKKAGYIVELSNGDIVAIDKPSIEKNFCFGYSDSPNDTEDYDRANAAADHARSSEEYFISENMREINRQIALLEGCEDSHHWVFRVCIPYSGQPEGSQLKAVHQYHWYDDSERVVKNPELAGIDRQRVIDGYKAVREDFAKRLERYLKRYGLSKVHAWSYWQDA